MNLLLELQNYCFANNFAGNLHVRCVPIEWIDTFPDYAQHGHNFSTAITLKPGKSWMMLPCVSDSIAFQERERDTKHGPMCLPTVTGFIANDTPNIAAVTNFMRAKEWIVAVIYKTGETKVIGSPDTPARFSSSFVNGRRLSDSKGYEIEFNSASEVKSFFLENEPEVSGCLPVVVSLNSQEVATVPSGQNVNIPVRTESGDAVGVYDDELGVWVVPDPIVCEDVDLEINGVNEGSFIAGSTIDLQLTDGLNPVTPVSVGRVGNTVTATLPAASTGWVRNPDWLPLPEITAADNRFVGLFLVFEGELNSLGVQANNNMLNIDWGDGSNNNTTGTNLIHYYDYATISGSVKQYYDGRNYKQVIVDIIPTGIGSVSGSMFMDRNIGINTNGCTNFVDISMSLNVEPVLSQQRKMYILERLVVYKAGNGSGNNKFNQMRNIQVFDFPMNTLTSVGLVFSGFGKLPKFQDFDISGSLADAFTGSFIVEFGKVRSTSTSLNQTWQNNTFLRKIEEIDCVNTTNINNSFNGCVLLTTLKLINCGNITTANTTFSSCLSLSSLTLQGMRIGFSVAQCAMGTQALNDLFTSLGTASGAQTIIVTGNPGAATCDTSIATGKGFAVTI
jgi:hypothetical protein